MLLTTDTFPDLRDALRVAEELSLPIIRTTYAGNTTSRVQIGTVLVTAFAEPRWRDLGSGPSWQEKFILREDVTVPIIWCPATRNVLVSYPVVSLLRQGGAKWGGVSVVSRDETDERPSTEGHQIYGYAAFEELGSTGTLIGSAATILPGVSFRQLPYAHDPSKLHWVMDLG